MKIDLKRKLIISFSLIGALPILVIGMISHWSSRASLNSQAYGNLEAVQGMLASRVERQFERARNELAGLVDSVTTIRASTIDALEAATSNKAEAVETLMEQVRRDIVVQQTRNVTRQGVTELFLMNMTSAEAAAVHERAVRTDELYGDFLEATGYEDYYIVATDGTVLHSHAQGSDCHTNVLTGPHSGSNLGRAVQAALQGQISFQDFEPYSGKDGALAAFVAAPILGEGGVVLGAVALQIPADLLQPVTGNRDGLGDTGESYVVAEVDGALQFRSTVTTIGEGRFVNGFDYTSDAPSLWRTVLGGQATTAVIDGIDGRPAFLSGRPLNVEGVHWAIFTRRDLEEAVVPSLEGRDKDYFAGFIETFGYYDAFLIDDNGDCFYTVAREADLGTNLLTGEFANSNLGQLIQRVRETQQPGICDVAPYAPSNNAPCFFIAAPVVENGRAELVVALQMSMDGINSIMGQRDGMGETGQAYLVGPDQLLRSDPPIETEFTVVSSFAQGRKVETEAVRQALAGQEGIGLIQDIDGENVLSRWTPVELGNGISWACIAEIEEDEVLAPVTRLGQLVGGLGVLMVLGVGLLGWTMGRKVANPVLKIIDELGRGSEEVASASVQVAAASQSVAEGSTEQAASLEEVSASLEEMSSMVKQSADNAQQVTDLTGTTQQLIGSGEHSMRQMVTSMSEIREASAKITGVLKIIEEIAFQVNLLALNAAVEAARAGEHGKGFAVVADEVRSLAMRASEAVKTTGEVITTAVHSSDRGSKIVDETAKVFSEIAASSAKVATLSAEVNTACREQATGIGQITEAVSQIDQVTQANSTAAEEAASASEEASAQAKVMRGAVARLAEIVLAVETQIEKVRKAQEPPAERPRVKAPKASPAEHPPAGGNGAPKNGVAKARRMAAAAAKPADTVDLSSIEF